MMPAMTRRTLATAAALAAALVGLAAAPVPAAAKPKETYIFLISRVDLAKGVPKDLGGEVSSRLRGAIDAHAEIDADLPKDAPDAASDPKKFKDYMKARRKRAFRLNVEVSQYSQELEAIPGRSDSQYLAVRISLRMFAEGYPERTMAIHGDGSATVKLEIGKQVRPADKKEANSSAIDEAVGKAISEVLLKLRQPPPSAKATKKRKT
jgi:hypothetical protein